MQEVSGKPFFTTSCMLTTGCCISLPAIFWQMGDSRSKPEVKTKRKNRSRGSKMPMLQQTMLSVLTRTGYRCGCLGFYIKVPHFLSTLH